MVATASPAYASLEPATVDETQDVGKAGMPDLGPQVTPEASLTGALTADLNESTALAVSADDGTVELTSDEAPSSLSVTLPPEVASETPEVSEQGAIVFPPSGSTGVTTEVLALADGRVSIQATLAGPQSPDSFRYELGDGQVPHLRPDGGIDLVSSATGSVIGAIDPPWAFDADGRAVPTSYSIDGSTVVQTVKAPDDATYPVVADPTFGHTYGIPTAYLNKRESRQAADAGDISAVCGAIGLWSPPAGVICGLNISIIVRGSKPIVASGKCVKLLLSPVSATPVAYTGGNCR